MKRAFSLFAALVAVTGTASAQNAKPRDCVAEMGPLPEKWEGTAFAIDGDTLAGVGLRPHIRIWGIQAPELRDKDKQETVPGMRSRAALVGLLAPSDGKVRCRVAKYDRYCRLVAQCDVPAEPQPLDLGLFMVLTGYAYGFYLEDTMPWDAGAGLRYLKAEAAALDRKAGLWKHWLGEK